MERVVESGRAGGRVDGSRLLREEEREVAAARGRDGRVARCARRSVGEANVAVRGVTRVRAEVEALAARHQGGVDALDRLADAADVQRLTLNRKKVRRAGRRRAKGQQLWTSQFFNLFTPLDPHRLFTGTNMCRRSAKWTGRNFIR